MNLGKIQGKNQLIFQIKWMYTAVVFIKHQTGFSNCGLYANLNLCYIFKVPCNSKSSPINSALLLDKHVSYH